MSDQPNNDDINALTTEIRERLKKQNELLQKAVNKYQTSQTNIKAITETIAKITTKLTDASKNLETIEKNDANFRIAKANREKQLMEAQKKMENEHEMEKKKLQDEKAEQATTASAQQEQMKQQLQNESEAQQKKLLDEQKAAEAKRAQEKEQEFNAKIQQSETILKQKEEDFKRRQEQSNNAQEESKKEIEIAKQQHQKDMEAAQTNEKKIELLTNKNNELETKLVELNATHKTTIEGLTKKGVDDLAALNLTHKAALETLRKELEEHEKKALADAEELNQSAMSNLLRQQELKTKSSNDAAATKSQEIEQKLQMCEAKFNKTQELYKKNQEELEKITNEFKISEQDAADALKIKVDELAKENEKLQVQIKKMLGSSDLPPNVALPSLDDNNASQSNSGNFGGLLQGLSKERRMALTKMIMEEDGLARKAETQKSMAMDPNQFWTRMVEADEFKDEDENNRFNDDEMEILNKIWLEHLTKGQQGGYKHGKKSNKRNKRSLKSKLSARKFSLKKRSKRKKKKGKSKKRRKSIKIRI